MKILFVIDSFREGGISSSLKNLLNNLDLEENEIFLFSFKELSETEKIKCVNVLESNYILNMAASTSQELKEDRLQYYFRKFLALGCRIFNSDRIYDLLFHSFNLNEKFDVAISFSNNVGDHSMYFGCNKFVLEKVNARKKIAWLHVNYESMKLNTKINNEEYSKFDEIIAVSEKSKQIFLKFNECLEYKTHVIYNVLNEKDLIDKALIPINVFFDKNCLNLVTVSRLDENKDPKKIIDVSIKLKEDGLKFKWRVLGSGPLLKEMKKLTIQSNLQDYVFWLGYIENPYPYIKNSDVYVSTSKSEGYGLSIAESLILKIPVVAGYYPSLYEVMNEKCGWIIDNNSDAFYDIISRLIRNRYEVEDKVITIYNLHPVDTELNKIEEILNAE